MTTPDSSVPHAGASPEARPQHICDGPMCCAATSPAPVSARVPLSEAAEREALYEEIESLRADLASTRAALDAKAAEIKRLCPRGWNGNDALRAFGEVDALRAELAAIKNVAPMPPTSIAIEHSTLVSEAYWMLIGERPFAPTVEHMRALYDEITAHCKWAVELNDRLAAAPTQSALDEATRREEAWKAWAIHQEGCAWCADDPPAFCSVGQSLYASAHAARSPSPRATTPTDTERLDWIESWTKGDQGIMPPGNHGGEATNWLFFQEDDTRDDGYNAHYTIEHEAPTLRAAIDAAFAAAPRPTTEDDNER